MPKPALGRGLGSLLTSGPKPEENQSQRAEVTPGVAALIQGGRENPSATAREICATAKSAPANQATVAATITLLRGLLIGADLLLCLLAFLLVHRSATVQFHELLFCAVAVIVGGALSWVALHAKTAFKAIDPQRR